RGRAPRRRARRSARRRDPVPDARPAPPRHTDPPEDRRRAGVARRPTRELGGVLRPLGPGAPPVAAASLAGRLTPTGGPIGLRRPRRERPQARLVGGRRRD